MMSAANSNYSVVCLSLIHIYSDAFYTWQFYKDTRDTILAYTVEITGMEGAAIKGNLYTQDYST